MHTYPRTNLVSPAANTPTERPAPPNTAVRFSDLLGHSLLLRPLGIRKYRSRLSGSDSLVATADVYDLTEDRRHDLMAIHPWNVVRILSDALDGHRTVAGVCQRVEAQPPYGGEPRFVPGLVELPSDQIAAAAAKADELGWNTPPNYDAVIGARIRAERTGQKMAQEVVAQHLGLSTSGVSDIENGKRAVTVGALYALAELFGLLPEELLV